MSGSIGFPAGPLIDPATGDLTDVWRRFFVAIYTRVHVQTLRNPIVLSPTLSPFIYTAPYDGTLFAAGGGIEAMTIKRGFSAAYPVGTFYGGTKLCAADQLTISYLSGHAPQLVFFPG